MSDHNRPRQNYGEDEGSDDINAHIVVASMSDAPRDVHESEDAIFSDLEDVDAVILDPEPDMVPPQKRRLGPKQIIVLAITAAFAVGGTVSIFKSDEQTPSTPVVSNASSNSTESVVTPTKVEVVLPAGLSYRDTGANSDPIPATTVQTAETTVTVTGSSGVSLTTPMDGRMPSSPVASVKVGDHTNANVIGIGPSTRAAAHNPLIAQEEEAKQLVAETSAASPSKPAPTKPPVKSATPPAKTQAVPAPVAHPDKSETRVQHTDKQLIASPKPITIAAQKSVTSPKTQNNPSGGANGSDSVIETIKPLISTTAEAFGLQSIQEGSITVLKGRSGDVIRLIVGDQLPSGEQIVRIDARSMVLVTDKSVIRFK